MFNPTPISFTLLRYFLEPKSSIMSEGESTIKASISELEILRQNKTAVETKIKEMQKELQEFK